MWLVNTAEGIKQTNRVSKSLTVCGLALSWRKNIFPIDERKVFFWHLWTRCICRAYKCAYNASLHFKNSKWVIPRRSKHKHITFITRSPAFGIGYGDLPLSIHCPLLPLVYYKFIYDCYVWFVVRLIDSSLTSVPQNGNCLRLGLIHNCWFQTREWLIKINAFEIYRHFMHAGMFLSQ